MKNSKISEAYAAALHNISYKNETLWADLKSIRMLNEVLTKEYIHSVANNGKIEEKKEWVEEVFQSWLPEYWMNLMYILIEKNKFHIIDDVAIDFLERGYESINISYGQIYVSKDISEEKLTRIENLMAKKLGRRVILTKSIDPYLIGGIKLEVENLIYDNSILGKTKELRDQALKVLAGE